MKPSIRSEVGANSAWLCVRGRVSIARLKRRQTTIHTIKSSHMCLSCERKPGYPERTGTCTGRTGKLRTEGKIWPTCSDPELHHCSTPFLDSLLVNPSLSFIGRLNTQVLEIFLQTRQSNYQTFRKSGFWLPFILGEKKLCYSHQVSSLLGNEIHTTTHFIIPFLLIQRFLLTSCLSSCQLDHSPLTTSDFAFCPNWTLWNVQCVYLMISPLRSDSNEC